VSPAENDALHAAIKVLARLYGNVSQALSTMGPRAADKLVKDALHGQDYRQQIGQQLRGAAARKRAARLRLEAAREAEQGVSP